MRFDLSLDLADRALALHPNSVHVRSFCGWVFHYLGIVCARSSSSARRAD